MDAEPVVCDYGGLVRLGYAWLSLSHLTARMDETGLIHITNCFTGLEWDLDAPYSKAWRVWWAAKTGVPDTPPAA